MALAEGSITGIRNRLSHEADVDLNEQSVLTRWVDDAEVERVEEMA